MKKASYKNILVERAELVGRAELAEVLRKRRLKIEQVILRLAELSEQVLHKDLDYIEILDYYYLTHLFLVLLVKKNNNNILIHRI